MNFTNVMMKCIHHDSIIENSFTMLKIPCVPSIHSSLFTNETLAITNFLFFTMAIILAFFNMSYSLNTTVCNLFILT